MKNNYLYFILPTCLLLFSFCKKDWLEGKPSKSLVVPTTVEDYQKLLNNRSIFGVNTVSLGEEAADDYFVPFATWNKATISKRVYVWADDIYLGSQQPQWSFVYNQILNCNVVIEGLNNLPSNKQDSKEWRSVLGQALFYRAWSYYNLAQVFCKPFKVGVNDSDQGLPLKLTSNVDEKVTRSTLKQTCDHVIKDLDQAYLLLPEVPDIKTRPSKVAVLALFARLYLSIEDYELAEKYSSSCLDVQHELMNYNELDTLANYPMPLFNKEVIWHAELATSSFFPVLNGLIDSVLYKSYADSDLRKNLYFMDRPAGKRFTGSYGASQLAIFCGLAVDEMYLIDAECQVRGGKIEDGLSLLNTLLKTRYKMLGQHETTFIPIVATNETDALKAILLERRKSLILRNVRWSDLRRLNNDPRFEKTLYRNLEGKIYELPPKHPNYTFLIDPIELRLLGLEQTQR